MFGYLASSTDMIPALFGLTAFCSILWLWAGLIEPQQIKTRLARIDGRAHELSQLTNRDKHKGHFLRRNGLRLSIQIARKFKLAQHAQIQKIRMLLFSAGYYSRDALSVYLFLKLLSPVVFTLVSVGLIYGMDVGGLSKTMKLFACLSGVTFGAYAPDIFLKNQAMKRKEALERGLPDALDLMVVCAEAGLSLDATLDRVGRELQPAWPILSDELLLTAAELAFLPERRDALENLATRTQLGALRGLTTTLIQAEKYGTPLARALRVLSAEMRDKRMMKAEEKAARLPAILTVPMIIFILPALFVVLIGPGAMRTMDSMRSFGW